jgi:cytochrome P450
MDHTGSMFGPGNFLNLDPPSHDLLRKIVRDSFSARRIMGLERAIRRHASELVDGFRDRGSADFARELATPLPLWVISEILGIPPVDRDEMGRRIHVILHRHAGDPEIPRDAYKAWEELRGLLR